MSVSFVIGPAGSGKTYLCMQEAVKEAEMNPKLHYLYIVPDQYTMQMQSLACDMSSNHATSNLEVLSFGRLALRVFDESRTEANKLLNDTGKNLIIQSIISKHEKELEVLGDSCHKLGSVAKVKSVISEFMQYGIGEKELEVLIKIANDNRRKRLAMKLRDLSFIYREFLQVLADSYETGETRYVKLAGLIPNSKFCNGAHLVFDAFTGFTPVQEGVIRELLKCCASAKFTLMADPDSKLNPAVKEDLFFLSANTKARIEKICDKLGVSRGEDITLNARLEDKPADLAFIQNNLFRTVAKFDGSLKGLSVAHTLTAGEEVKAAADEILKAVKEDGYAYRDIAIVAGDLAGIQDIIKKEFAIKGIPFYLDSSSPIFSNMLLKAVRNLLNAKESGCKIKDMFAFIRSLIPFEATGLGYDNVDKLENFCLKEGILFEAQWHKEFFGRKPLDDEETRDAFEDIRQKVVQYVDIISSGKILVRDRIKELYQFIVQIDAEEALFAAAKHFEEQGDYAQAEILSQIYRNFCKVLEQIYDFCEVTSDVEDFEEMLSAALSEIRIGTIPLRADEVLVGDIERSRIPNVKTVIFIGVNDGSVPVKQDKADVLSDIDRLILEEAAAEDIILSPGPRELMFRQRLYLYMVMTKPSEKLIITYSERDAKGETPKLPSYLIGELKKTFVQLKDEIVVPSNIIWDDADLVRQSAGFMRKVAAGELSEEDKDMLYVMSAMMNSEEHKPVLFGMLDAAFHEYIHVPLGTDLAVKLYGGDLSGSVSAFTMFTECQYKYFLNKGLKVRPRDELKIDNAFTGTLYHEVMELVAKSIIEEGLLLSELTDEELDTRLEKVMAQVVSEREKEMVDNTAKNKYLIDRCARIARRSLYSTRNQMKAGAFRLFDTERKFEESVELDVSDGQRHTLKMNGVIDRIDVAELEGREVIRVIDYKSSEHVLDHVKLTHGLNLQLPMYMYEMLKTNPQAIPAAMFYFTLQDPYVEESVLNEEKYSKALRNATAMKGIVNSERAILDLIDPSADYNRRSKKIEKIKSENLDALSYTTQGIVELCEDIVNQCKETGESILSGNIEVNPYYITEKDNGCAYCDYASICEIRKEKKKDLYRHLVSEQEEEEE